MDRLFALISVVLILPQVLVAVMGLILSVVRLVQVMQQQLVANSN